MSNWVITAPQPEAVEAGADILRDGGVIIPESHWVENWTSPAFD